MKLEDKAQLRLPMLQPWLPFVMLRKPWLILLVLQNECLAKCFGETITTVTLHATQPLPVLCGNTLLEGNNCYNLISPVEVIWLH